MMQIINSIHNPHVQALRALYERKGRREAGCFVAEGVNIVKDIPATATLHAYYVAESRYGEVSFLLREGVGVYVLADALFERVVETVSPSGVVAVVEYPKASDAWKKAERLLVLDGVADPGNVGTILRTACAAGFSDVVLLGGADPFSPKVVRASMGGVMRLRVHCLCAEEFTTGWERTVYLLDMAGENLFSVVPAERYALVVGSEAKGACDAVRARANEIISIPMQSGMESLNAGVAMAIAMYVLTNK